MWGVRSSTGLWGSCDFLSAIHSSHIAAPEAAQLAPLLPRLELLLTFAQRPVRAHHLPAVEVSALLPPPASKPDQPRSIQLLRQSKLLGDVDVLEVECSLVRRLADLFEDPRVLVQQDRFS